MTKETLLMIYLGAGLFIALIHFIGPVLLTRGNTPLTWFLDRNLNTFMMIGVGVLMWAMVVFLWPVWVVMITSIFYKARAKAKKKAEVKKIFEKHTPNYNRETGEIENPRKTKRPIPNCID